MGVNITMVYGERGGTRIDDWNDHESFWTHYGIDGSSEHSVIQPVDDIEDDESEGKHPSEVLIDSFSPIPACFFFILLYLSDNSGPSIRLQLAHCSSNRCSTSALPLSIPSLHCSI
ncbi:hypothetical protein PENTCL1PPCAC_26962, partial [Pristionchus entomophagus]